MSLSKITTITFDADDTLWDFNKVMNHALKYSLDELYHFSGVREKTLTIEKMIGIRNEVALELKGKITNLESIRLEAFKRTLLFIGISDDLLAEHLNAVYLKHRFEDIELYDDVIPTLHELRKCFKIGLFSNGNSYPDSCGLDGVFEFEVFSQDYGIEKPDERIFRKVMEQAKCSNDEWMHIGDSLQNDVDGANRIGATSIWLNRSGKKNTTPIVPDYEISVLNQLNFILK